MRTPRARCHECCRYRPEQETVLVAAKIGGDYRRAARWGRIRVCRDCVQARVNYARKGQAGGLNSPVSSGRISWASAARAFGIDITGLKERS